MSSNKGDINATVFNGFLKGDPGETPVKGLDYWTDEDKQEIVQYAENAQKRVTTLDDTVLADNKIIEAVGNPVFVGDDNWAEYESWNLTEKGWYVFAKITAKPGTVISADATVDGAASYTFGDSYVNVAVRFEVAAVSQKVVIDWGEETEIFVFKATDLAVDNLDYRVTFYVYSIEPYAKWEFTPTTDATFTAGKYYYIKDGDGYALAEVTTGETVPAAYYEDLYTLTEDETFATGKTYYTESGGTYTAAEVTAGEDVAADTYYEHAYVLTEDETFGDGKAYYTESGGTYTAAEVTTGEALPTVYFVHSKVTFEGMIRNVTYVCDMPIDCPVVFKLPVVEDETHGCWFEIRFRHTGSYSSTLVVPEGVKVATEHTQPETAGINSVDLHYTAIGDLKIWRFLNTHSSIPV